MGGGGANTPTYGLLHALSRELGFDILSDLRDRTLAIVVARTKVT